MSLRPALAAALVALGAALLGGCSSLPFLSDKASEEETAGAPPIADRAVYELEIEAPRELRGLLGDYMDLARFQRVPATDAITSTELDRLVAAAPAQARELLETEGYFNAQVRVRRASSDEGEDVISVQVEPGPRTIVEKWSVDVAGEMKERVDKDEEDAVVELAALRRGWALKADEPFRQAAWTAAKNGTLARLRAQGYPAASWLSTQATVNAEANTAQTRVVAESGPLFHLGETQVEGLERYDESSVRRLTTFRPGEPYSEQLMLDYQERLLKVGLFEGAVVDIEPDPAKAKSAPVRVRVKELPLQTATVGVGYSANTGPRLTLEHTHRRVFGRKWIAKNEFELGPQLRSWEGELTSHPLNGLYRNLIAGSAERLRSAEELRTSWSARVGRTQDTPRIERLYYLEWVHSRLETQAGTTSSSDAASFNYHWIWRDVDSVLLPTRGLTLSAQGALGHARGRELKEEGITEGRGPFVRTLGRVTWYKPIGNEEAPWYTTLRLEAGQVFAADRVAVPDTLLFRAGGDESVRGYAFRTLGPIVNDVVTSGRVLLTGSAEIARPISRRLPAFWWALFVDAGNAANHWQELDPAVGYGVGLRWRSPVGPLRLDLAYGHEIRKPRVHLSVGIAF